MTEVTSPRHIEAFSALHIRQHETEQTSNRKESAMPEDRIIYRQDLYKMLGVTSETLRRWILENRMPRADIAITQRTVGWRLSTLHAAGIKLV